MKQASREDDKSVPVPILAQEVLREYCSRNPGMYLSELSCHNLNCLGKVSIVFLFR